MSSSLTDVVIDRAAHVARSDVPSDVVEIALDAVLDTLGVAVAGAGEPIVTVAAADARPTAGGSVLVGGGRRVPAEQAALVNGSAAHALDFDDTHIGFMGHPTTPVLAAVLALAEATGADGAAVLRALVVGVEAECLLGELVSAAQYAAGWHTTALLGAFGAALGCAALLELDRASTGHALALAAVSASGTRSAFGTMAKPLQVGMAARNGLLAARWAAGGMTGPAAPLDGGRGFAALHGARPDVRPGDPTRWRYRDVVFKYHASCFLTHAPIDAARSLARGHGIAPADLRAVAVRVSPTAAQVCDRPRPLSGLDRKFSVQTTVAMALCGIETSAPSSFDGSVPATAVQAVAGRVSVAADPTLPTAAAEIVLTLRDGTTLGARSDANRPEPDATRRRARLLDKFDRIAGPLLGGDRGPAVPAAVRALPRSPDLTPLLGALCADLTTEAPAE